MANLLKFRLVGEDLTPDKVSANEFSKLVSAYENALIAFVSRDNPTMKHTAFISVVGIKNESLGVEFLPNKEALYEASDIINRAINNNTISKLPFETVQNLEIIQRFVDTRECIAELNGYEKIESTKITPSTNLKINETFYVRGETLVYGKIMRIGGSEPRVRIEFDNGKQFSVITNQKEAKRLSPHLYEKVGIKGMAKWKKENNELINIKPKSFILMENNPLKKRMKGLGELLGKYWVDVENPDDYTASLRA